jgi:tRNA(Ile)-lysidine synthase TilS/MesJ
MLENFLYQVCGCQGNWTMESFIESQVAEIRKKVGDRKVLCALSGGVDSSVAAVLVHKAVGNQLTCIYVDHGFMRKMNRFKSRNFHRTVSPESGLRGRRGTFSFQSERRIRTGAET